MSTDESTPDDGTVTDPTSPDEPTTDEKSPDEGSLRSIRLTDARTMRALAHPLRLRLLGELRTRGPQSVGQLGDLLDEAPGSISYHVGKLAEFGFVEPAPELARDRRERWWRAAHQQTSWEPLEMLDDPELRVADGILRRAILNGYQAALEKYLEAEATEDRDWVRGAVSSDAMFHLTADELSELRADLDALEDRWQGRSNPERDGTRPITLIYHAFPRPL